MSNIRIKSTLNLLNKTKKCKILAIFSLVVIDGIDVGLLVILIIFIGYIVYNHNKVDSEKINEIIRNTNAEIARNNARRNNELNTSSVPKQPPPTSQSYRPIARTSTSSAPKIQFTNSFNAPSTNSAGRSTNTVTASDLSGLNDAFTGAPLDEKLGLHQCQKCQVFYHSESVTLLLEVNSGQCVACQSTQIRAISVKSGKTGRNYTPDVITLANYKEHVGSVVTFEARVVDVKESRRGNDFAVMFERKSWSKGFKLVFFRDAVRKVGGKSYISRLDGRTVKVRGLVIEHPMFGYEIVVSEKSMILSVR